MKRHSTVGHARGSRLTGAALREWLEKRPSGLGPIDLHCHGSGAFDFARSGELELDQIEASLEEEGISAVLTLFVPYHQLETFEDLCRSYAQMARGGTIRRILGLGCEGPLLASVGGTPERGSWLPTKSEWQRFARLGEFGLRYMVLSPDMDLRTSAASDCPTTVEWIVDALLRNGIKPAVGHFLKNDPEHSAACARKVFDRVEHLGLGPALTDHLYNDMPLNFRHAWRTRRERKTRYRELASADLESWTPENLPTALGPVPATIIRAAWDGLVKICLNFDGAHVDERICKRTVELVGSRNLLLMTDRINSGVLAGEKLSFSPENSLFYQNDGIVAGGSCAVWNQVENMAAMGLDHQEIADICHDNAVELFGLDTSNGVLSGKERRGRAEEGDNLESTGPVA